MKKSFLVITIFLIFNMAYAAEVSNLVEPVNYHVNHTKELIKIKQSLLLHKQVSLIGISGIGKTQLSRKYADNYKDRYRIIWFFESDSALDYQFLQLAKEINKNLLQKEKIQISESIDTAQQSVMNYLATHNDYLLIFDNLKINQNHKVQNIANWEHNGHIIFCSQDSNNLNKTINISYLEERDSNSLIKNIGPTISEDLTRNLVLRSKGYPIALARAAIFLDNNRYITSDEYDTYFRRSNNNMETYMKIIIEKINANAKRLLYKIALLNNQEISKSLIKVIADEETFIENLVNLHRYKLISLAKEDEENPIFEMHDKIKSTLLEMESGDTITGYVSEIVDQLNKFMPVGKDAKQALANHDNTLLKNLEALLINAQEYKVNPHKILELRKNLMSIYLGMGANRCQELSDWFFQHEVKLCKKNNIISQQAVCGEYLVLLGIYNYFVKIDHALAMDNLKKAEKIISSLDGYPELKYMAFSQLAQAYLHRGEKSLTEFYVSKSEEVEKENPKLNYDAHLLPYIKTRNFMASGDYQKAIEVVNGVIEKIKHQPIDYYNGNVYVMKASIQNSLGEFEQSYGILKKIYDMDINNILLGAAGGIRFKVVMELSRAELGLSKIEEALYHANQAVEIYIKDPMRSNNNLHVSEDIELAEAFVAHGDVLVASGEKKRAIESYSQAEVIFFNHYKKNIANLDEVSSLYKKAVDAAYSIGDKYSFNKFKKRHIDKFGIENFRSKEILKLPEL